MGPFSLAAPETAGFEGRSAVVDLERADVTDDGGQVLVRMLTRELKSAPVSTSDEVATAKD